MAKMEEYDGIAILLLTHQCKLSGGNIKNTALASAFLTAEDERLATMTRLFQARRREYQKMEETLSESELNGIKQEPRGEARLAR